MSVGNFRSARVDLKAGVPQGSVLSPLLFNLYVNDIVASVSSCRVFQYADDTVVVSSHLNYDHALQLLSYDSMKVMDWFDANLIKINASKTKLVCFKNPLKRLDSCSSFVLHKSDCLDCNCPQL